MRKLAVLVLCLGCGVSESVTTRCVGLWTQGNPLSAPDGALAVAENAVISQDDVVEQRRGICTVSTSALSRLFPFKGGLVGWGSDVLRHSADGVTWADFTGSYPAPSGYPVRKAEAGSRLFLTGSTGVRRLVDLATTPTAAGIPAAPDCYAYTTVAGSPSLLATNESAAYRVVWGKRIGKYTLLGVPSGRCVVKNTGATADVGLLVAAPPGVDASYFFQVYRSPVAASGETPSDEMALIQEQAWPYISARVVSMSRSGGVVTVTTNVEHGLKAQGGGLPGAEATYLSPGNVAFPAGTKWPDTVPSATTWTYLEDGADTGVVAIDCALERVAYIAPTDSTPDGLRQAALYTSPSQEGALSGNAVPPIARDVALFRGALVFANLTLTPQQTISYLGGMQAGDTLTVNGVTLTAGTDISFGGSPDPATEIALTASNIAWAINTYRPAFAQARYASSETDFPGKIAISGLPGDSVLTIVASRASSFGPSSLGAAAELHPSGIAWTKTDQPEAVPQSLALIPKIVGSADRETLRVIPTRDSVFIFKDGEGTYRLSGETPDSFRIDPFDLNCHLVAPESAVALDNKVWMLTEQGVVAVTDTGVELVSRAIEPEIKALLTPAMRPVTAALAFGIAYESERKYILFAPTLSTDTQCTQAFVLDLLAFGRTGSGWTRWDIAASHGIVDPASDKLTLVDGTSVWRERKDGLATDYADETYSATISSVTSSTVVVLSSVANLGAGDVLEQGAEWGIVTDISGTTVTLDRTVTMTTGAATVYRAIAFSVEWLPRFAPPGKLHHFIEAGLQFRNASFASAVLSFATDLDSTAEDLAFAMSRDGGPHPVLVTSIPRNKARGAHLRVGFAQTQARAPIAIEALTVGYSPGLATVRPRVGGVSGSGAMDSFPLA